MRISPSGMLLGLSTGLLVAASAGCSANRANCQTVKLQREAGRSDSEIASNLGITDADIAKCSGGGGSAEAPPSPDTSGGAAPGGGGAPGGGKPPM
jgi:hypothetical protein